MMPTKNKGFTLIELLVVISIISLLSSTVLASVKVARDRTYNASNTQSMTSFITALQLMYDQNGGYSTTDDIDPFSPATIGSYPGVSCYSAMFSTNLNHSAQLESNMGPFLSSLPKMSYYSTTVYGSYPYDICPGYRCNNVVAGKCTSVALAYPLKGLDQKCLPGFSSENYGFYSDITECYTYDYTDLP